MPENLIEGLVALIFFVVLPLLQWLRERTAKSPRAEVPGDVRRRVPPAPRPAPSPGRPPTPAEARIPPRTAPPPQPPIEGTRGSHRRHEPAANERPVPVMLPPEGPVAPRRPAAVEVPPQVLRRRALARALRDRQTVQRAMIFATILGPCRANDAER